MNISNVAALVDTEGKPHFKYVVEGANLFLTQQARLYLEKRKVVLFKDSSANKGTHISPVADDRDVLIRSGTQAASRAPPWKSSPGSRSPRKTTST